MAPDASMVTTSPPLATATAAGAESAALVRERRRRHRSKGPEGRGGVAGICGGKLRTTSSSQTDWQAFAIKRHVENGRDAVQPLLEREGGGGE